MVCLSRYAVAVLAVGVTTAGTALAATDGAYKSLETAPAHTEEKAEARKEGSPHSTKKKILLGAGVGSALALAVLLFGLKALGSKMVASTHAAAGKKLSLELISLTEKITLTTDKGIYLVEFKYPDGFSAKAKQMTEAEKSQEMMSAAALVQSVLDRVIDVVSLTQPINVCGFDITMKIEQGQPEPPPSDAVETGPPPSR